MVRFVFIHLLSKNMKFLSVIPRSRFLSVAGGISVAYVFVHLLPELEEHQQVFDDGEVWVWLGSHAYVLAMVGLSIFYGLERLVKTSKRKNTRPSSKPTAGIFWLHIWSFFLYNALIGSLLVQEEYEGLHELFFNFLALAVHFISNDHGLREHHRQVYDRFGRFILASGIVLGWIVGHVLEVNEMFLSFLFAFLAGGIILNVLKEELPEDREATSGHL
ncbi:hypothetical protein [Bacillus coahuilensis]